MRTIVLFAKAPVPGRVKTRLISRLGAEPAAALYRALAQDTLDLLTRVAEVNVRVAYEPHASLPEPDWLSEGQFPVEWFPQSEGDLGQRLRNAFEHTLSAGDPVIAVGSDLPSLTVELIDKAFSLLKTSPAVFGPSDDGGYYLAGFSRPCPEAFEKIPWSTSRVLSETLARLDAGHVPYRLLPGRFDIDVPEDLARLQKDERLLERSGFRRTADFLQSLPC